MNAISAPDRCAGTSSHSEWVFPVTADSQRAQPIPAYRLAIMACCLLLGVHASAALGEDAASTQDRSGGAPDPHARPAFANTVLRVEGMQFVDARRPAEQSGLLDFTTHARWQSHPDWEVQVGLNVFAEIQRDNERSIWEATGDLDESFVRYRSPMHTVTLGTQRVRWGQMDYRPPTNRLAAYDQVRFPFSDRGEQLPVPALRWEYFGQAIDTEWLWLPSFRASRLPDPDNPWYPVDRQRGLIAGIDLDPNFAPWLAVATIEDKAPSGPGGAGLRLRGTSGRIDYALTAQHGRRSLPYYELDPDLARRLRSGLATAGQTFGGPIELGSDAIPPYIQDLVVVRTRYPFATSLGGDLAWQWGNTVWRAEAAWVSDAPVTTPMLQFTTVAAFEWAVALETFPFGSETRLSLQFSGDHLLDAGPILDPAHSYTLTGSLERYSNRQRWRTRLRYLLGYDPRQGYVNPQIAYLAHDSQEFFAELHWFGGANETPIGYFRNHDLILFGWRKQYN